MALTVTCPRGHQWQPFANESTVFLEAKVVCPVCGAVVELPESALVRAGQTDTAQGLSSPAARTMAPGGDDPGPGPSPRKQVEIAGYRILQELGRGAMGVVYEAVQISLHRLVALKVIRAGAHTDPERLARFRGEAQAAARLRHPNIVQVYEVDEVAGVPFFSMEYVEGGDLAQHLHGGPLPAPQAAQLLETLAGAVHHAHHQGVIHRDLKPANILLAPDGTPKVSDFGLAKLLDEAESAQTQSGAVMGTPCYMAPEQAAGLTRQISPAVDVYALGAILYECLTGRPPFQAATALETLEQVRSQEPVPPSQLQPRVSRDLQTICLKALAKEPGRRYASALELADDLRRFREGKPIRARRVGDLERLGRWCRRNPALATLGGLTAAALLTVAALSIGLAIQESRAADRLRVEQHHTLAVVNQLERLVAGLALDKSLTTCERGNIGSGMLALAECLKRTDQAGAGDLEQAVRANLAAWYTQLSPLRLLLANSQGVTAVAISPDGKTLLTGSYGGSTQLWDAATGKRLGLPFRQRGDVRAVAFRPDGKAVITAGGDPQGGQARVWDVATGQPLLELRPESEVRTVAFRPDGRSVLTAGVDGTAQLWDAASGKRLWEVYHCDQIMAAAFSPDGKTLATASMDQTARLWDASTGEPRLLLTGHTGEIWAVAFSPDGKTVATGSLDQTIRLWSTDTGQPILKEPLEQHAAVLTLAFSPDGRTLLTGGAGGRVLFWHTDTGAPARPSLKHPGLVFSAVFGPDGKSVLTGCGDGLARLWEVELDQPRDFPLTDLQTALTTAFSPDGRLVAVGGTDQGAVRLWVVATGQPRFREPLRHQGDVLALAFSRDSRLLLTGSADQTARLWRVSDGKPFGPPLFHELEVWAVAFSPDGQTAVTADSSGFISFWEVETGKLRTRLSVGKGNGQAQTLAFSPDGQVLLIGSRDGAAHLWSTATQQPLASPLMTPGGCWSAAFSPDGKTLVTGSRDGTAQWWEVSTGKPIGPALPHRDKVQAVAFGPDGRTILTGSADGQVRLWDVATGKPIGPPLTFPTTVRGSLAVAYTPDGRLLMSNGGRASVRTLPVPVKGGVEQTVLWTQVITGMERDADGVVRPLDPAAWQQRRQHLDALGGPLMPGAVPEPR